MAILMDESGFSNHDFVMPPRGGVVQELSCYYPAHDPLYFVVFFPCGDDGWHRQRRLSAQGTVER